MNFVIYGKPNCQFCEMSKQLLSMREKEFEYLTLDQDYDFEVMTQAVIAATGIAPRTFPQIFVEELGAVTHVGGFTELRDFMAQLAE
jgi:glutaredoxin